MNYLKIVALFALLAISAKGCELNGLTAQEYMIECGKSKPELLGQLFLIMGQQNTDSMAATNLICKNQREIVDLAMCFSKKVRPCIPVEAQPMIDLIVNKDRMLNALQYMCNHSDILKDNCMKEHMEAFTSCYMEKVRQISASVTPSLHNDFKGILCKVIRSEEQCFRENGRECSKKFVEVIISVLERFFPMSHCPKTSIIPAIPLRDILVRGEPNYRPYIIKN